MLAKITKLIINSIIFMTMAVIGNFSCGKCIF